MMGRVDGNLTEFLRDGNGVETTDGRFAPNMNGLKALLAARQSELKSAFSKEATQNARMEADGIAGSPQGKAGRTEYLRAVVKGLLQREGVGKGGVSVPSGCRRGGPEAVRGAVRGEQVAGEVGREGL